SKIEGRSITIQSYSSRTDSSASCRRSGSMSRPPGIWGAVRTSTPSELTTKEDQSGSPDPSIWLKASSMENSGLILRKKASEPLLTSKSASRTRLPESLFRAKAVSQARVEAPEPGLEQEKTTS